MGGCRCTYRNCTVRSDGQTHMFHYPVFEKVRCHKWLTNACRLDFLNLKVSQLKNRVVCQHHFKDDNFMNFKRDKLTFEAVPTEDGPYCDSSKLEDIKPKTDLVKDSITVDDIENDCVYTLTDKIANFSVKYGDFLTNSELSDLDMLKECTVLTNARNNNCDNKLSLNSSIDTHHYKKPAITKDDKNNQKQVLKTKQCVKNNNLDAVTISNPNLLVDKNGSLCIDEKGDTNKGTLKKESKVQIISEEKVSEPVALTGVLEPVSPSLVLHIPKKKQLKVNNKAETVEKSNIKEPSNQKSEQHLPSVIQKKDFKEPVAIEINIDTSRPIHEGNYNLPHNTETNTQNEKMKVPPQKCLNAKNRIVFESSPHASVLKNKIPPERAAAILEKRKFNMKLRDIIENCLNGLEETDHKKVMEIKTKKAESEKVGSFLSTEPNLPNNQEYTIAYLDARIKRMEDNLLHKIGQNTKNIIELKQAVISAPQDKITTSTQTAVSEESHKKYLFKEISKYLSPEANNLIYEELFINKYAQNTRRCSPSPKRRKRR